MAETELAWRWSRGTENLDADLLRAANELADVEAAEKGTPFNRTPNIRPGVLIATAAAVVLASALFLPGWVRDSSDVATVRRAVAEVSRTGMVLTADIAPPGPTMRSDDPGSRPLTQAVNRLASRVDSPRATEDITYWLAAGMLADNDPNVRTVLDDALERWPNSTRLLNLRAVAAYRDGRLEDADRALSSVLEKHPNDPVALFNRTLLLSQEKRTGEMEAAQHALTNALEPGSPLQQRAKKEFLLGPP
jgi:tetratricopeptide (TPR) repeat protein